MQETMQALFAALRVRNPLLQQQSEQVRVYAIAIGRRLGLPKEEVALIGFGALLHDVGKLGVPETILRKPGPLDEAEWAVVRRHPEIGAEILARAPALAPLVPIVRGHHERYDGAGYPDRLAGETIPLAARIVAVADAFDAMISDRPYRRGMPVQQAMEEFGRCAGTQFDPGVVKALCDLSRGPLPEPM